MHRLTLLLFVLVLAACQPITAPSQSASPLSRGAVQSPLQRGGVVLPPDEERLIFATIDEQRSQFRSAPADLSLRATKVYLTTIIHRSDYPCGANAVSDELLNLILNHPEQKHVGAACSARVTAVAQARAEDMVNQRYYSHTSLDGTTPNEWLDKTGCLPDYYPKTGNMVESIGLNYFTAQTMLEAFSRSPTHWTHLMGKHPGYANQLAFGVGYAHSDERTVFVVLATPGCNS